MKWLASALAVAVALAPVPALPQPAGTELARGITQVEEGDLEGALVTLQAAIRNLAAAGRPKDLARAYLYLGIAQLGLGDSERAQASMREARRTDPALTLDPKAFPPRVIQLYESTAAAQPPAAAPEAAGVAIEHKPVNCIVAETYPQIEACRAGQGEVARARVHFRAEGTPHWYYVEMEPRAGCYAGVMPRPLKSTRRISYYVEMVDRAFAEGRTAEHNPQVVASAQECKPGLALATIASSAASVLVGAPAGAPLVPAGFNAAGVLAAAQAGAASAGAASTASTGGAAGGGTATAAGGGGGGMSGAAIGLLAGAAAAAGAAVLVLKKKDPLEVDDDGDGFTENAGDCNDANPQVKPNGGFAFTVDFAFTGSVPCSQRNARAQTYRVQNNSCAALTINALSHATTFTGQNCGGTTTAGLGLQASSVAPGSSAVIRTGAAAGTAVALCCARPPCVPGECRVAEQITLTTSAGAQSASNSFGFIGDDGRGCRCTGVTVDYQLAPVEPGAGGWLCTPGHP